MLCCETAGAFQIGGSCLRCTHLAYRMPVTHGHVSCLQVHEYVRPKVEAAVDAARRVVDSREMASMPRQACLLPPEKPCLLECQTG